MNAEKRGKEIEKQVACPFCHSADTEMIALFGMQMMTSQYYCRACRSAFEAVKWEEPKSKAKSQKSKSE
jgi:transposase-like protein